MAIPTIRIAASALAVGLGVLSASALPAVASGHGGHPWPQLESSWTEVNADAPWSARAGLQAVTLDNTVFVLGGRVPKPPSFPPIPGDSTLLNDVWSSSDRGATWTNLVPAGTEGIWAPRGYFSAVTKGRFMYVIGGQDFRVTPNPCPPPGVAPDCPPVVSSSQFFNDVWRSADGVHLDPDDRERPVGRSRRAQRRSTGRADLRVRRISQRRQCGDRRAPGA